MGLKQQLVIDDKENIKTIDRYIVGVHICGQNSHWWAKRIAWTNIVFYNISISIHVASIVLIIVPLLEGRVRGVDQHHVEATNNGEQHKIGSYHGIAQEAVKLILAAVQFSLGFILLQGVVKENVAKVKAWVVGTMIVTIVSLTFITLSFVFMTDVGMGVEIEEGGQGQDSYLNFMQFVLWNMPWTILTIYFVWIVNIFLKELKCDSRNGFRYNLKSSDGACDCDCCYDHIVGPRPCLLALAEPTTIVTV